MDTLLLVDSDKQERHSIREYMQQHDIVVLETISGKRSLEVLQQHLVNIILLNLDLPDGNGLDFINDIRKYSEAPLIVISNDKNLSSSIFCLERGADDFVLKPFAPNELLARIKLNLRRCKNLHSNMNFSPNNTVLQNERVTFGNWVLDFKKFQIYNQNGASGELTSKEFKILALLVEHTGQVIKREDLCHGVKEGNYVPTPRAIDVKIARIRKKIEDHAEEPQIITTVRGIGYMFNKK